MTESYAAQVSLFQQLKTGAGSRIRTDDLLITNQLLYQLSYAGIYLGKYDQHILLFGFNDPQKLFDLDFKSF